MGREERRLRPVTRVSRLYLLLFIGRDDDGAAVESVLLAKSLRVGVLLWRRKKKKIKPSSRVYISILDAYGGTT